MTQQENPVIIIAGTTKSGTGSLFNYLGDHPAICPSNIKETRFFLGSLGYDLPIKYSINIHGIGAYRRFFGHCSQEKIQLEATPDYLYSKETAGLIREFVPNPRLIFILRDPVDRLVSWYRFAVQQSLIENGQSFPHFVQRQFDWESNEGPLPGAQCMHSLEQGCYAKFLEPYLSSFSKAEICVTRFETMVGNEKPFMKAISKFCGIDESFYDDYEFNVVNKTRVMRRYSSYASYVRFRRAIRMRVHNIVWLKNLLRTARRCWEPLYFRLAAKPGGGIEISPQLEKRLERYYREDRKRLRAIFREHDCNGWR